MKIKLEYPIPVESNGGLVEVSSITLKRLKAKHFKKLPKAMFDGDGTNISPDEMIPLIAVLSDLEESSIEEMDAVDLIKIGGKVGDFLSESLQTGKN